MPSANRQQPSSSRVLPCFAATLLVLAPCAFVRADSVRIGLRVIADGDSSAKLLDVAGRPDSTKHVKASRKHADGGERWTYLRDGKSIEFTLHDGVVTAIVTHRER